MRIGSTVQAGSPAVDRPERLLPEGEARAQPAAGGGNGVQFWGHASSFLQGRHREQSRFLEESLNFVFCKEDFREG